jgi:repressor LexA
MTEREKELLMYIILFKQTNGYSPSVREMMEGLNTKSVSHISQMLEELKDKNYIDYQRNASRTIVVKKFDLT